MLWVLSQHLGKDLRVRREDIAEMVGTTLETAIRTLVDFRNKKLISSGWKRISILDAAALKTLSGIES
jgi:CRP-like cAMP-binding protein